MSLNRWQTCLAVSLVVMAMVVGIAIAVSLVADKDDVSAKADEWRDGRVDDDDGDFDNEDATYEPGVL